MSSARGLAETARLVAELDLRDNMSRGLGTAMGSLGRFESGLSRIGRGAGQVASGLDRLGTRAAIAAGTGIAAVVQASASFEQAFTGIEKTVDETATTTFPKLEEALRSMARTIPVSFEELAGIGEQGGALGIAADDLESFIDVVARLAVSTNLSSDQAATALGQLGNVLHLRGDDFRDFADSLVALGNAGASTESQIVDIAARFGAAGNAAGLSKEEILALSSAVASMGIEVEAGGSALSRIFNSVATNIGTSSDKAVAFADTLGLSAKEFRRAWEEDALGTFQDFLTELGKLDQFEQAKVLKDIGITNTRDVNTVRLMGQNVGFVADQLRIAQDAQGALNTESQKFFDTASGQFKVLFQNLRDAGVTVGNQVLPIFKELTQEATEFLNRPETRDALKRFGQELADGIRRVVAEIRRTDFSGVIEGLKQAASIAKTAFDVFNALPTPLKSAIIAGIAVNKATGGALGQITGGIGNIAGGLFGQGGIFSRGSRGNPMFVSVVGGGLGGPGVVPGGAGGVGGLLLRALGFAGAGVAGFELGSLIGHQFFDPTVRPAQNFEERRFEQFLNNPASKTNVEAIRHNLEAVDGSLDRLIGENREGRIIGQLLFGDQIAVLESQEATLKELLRNAQQAGQGNFVPQNPGGTPGTPAGQAPGADLFKQTLKVADKALNQSMREGHNRAARNAQRSIDATNLLRADGKTAVERFIAGLGKQHAALSAANRNLDEGNVLQQRLGTHVDRVRDRLGTGFREVTQGVENTAARTHRHLSGIEAQERNTAANTGVISRKDFSPHFSLDIFAPVQVTVDAINRAQTSARIAIGRGPLETFD